MSNFVELKDFPGYFIAHSPARLRRVVRDKILECTQTPNSKQDNYWTVTVKTKEGKYVKRSMHRLLMETFVPNPLNKPCVCHKDNNPQNNHYKNLYWSTVSENNKQKQAYKESVMPTGIPRIAIEAGVPFGWSKYTGSDELVLGINKFGASAPGDIVYEKYGFTVENIVAMVQKIK